MTLCVTLNFKICGCNPMVLYPASRGYIFAVWAGMQKVASADTVQFSIMHAWNSWHDLPAKLTVRSVVKWSEVCRNKKLRQLWSATQDSCSALNRSRTGKNPVFLSLFIQISGRIWKVVSRGYLLYDSSHSENVAFAHRVMLLPFKWNLFNRTFA